MLRFDNLQAPTEDGGILIEPPSDCWMSLVKQNIRRLGRLEGKLAGASIREARLSLRSRLFPQKADQPIVAAGHQPEFVHPGVWAKYVAMRAFGDAAGLPTIDFVVDNDAPHAPGLRLPAPANDGHLQLRDVAFSQAPAGSAHEGRPPISRERLEAIRAEIAAALGRTFDESLMPVYLEGVQACGEPVDAVDQHLAGCLRVDAALGAAVPECRVSRVFDGPFLADLLLNADRFAACYNASLSEYRRAQNIRSPDRPLPDLARDEGRIETALWIYQPLQRRRRLWVEPREDRLLCYADAMPVGELSVRALDREPDSAVAGLRPWLIRPRALALTLWIRLLACDLFVHGIGGAKYDRITDDIFRGYYGCEPPEYVCVSATLRSPWPMFAVTEADVADARRRVRDWRFNPQRYCPDLPPALLAEREDLIRRSDRLWQARGPRQQRREVFTAIRAVNAALTNSRPDVGHDLAARCDRLARQAESNAIAAGREYFYALQPGARLEMLAGRLARAF